MSKKNHRGTVSLLVALLAATGLMAEDAASLTPKAKDDWSYGTRNWKDDGSFVTVSEQENGALALKGDGWLLSKTALKLDPSKKYRLSGFFKSAPGSKPSVFYFGLAPIDAQGRVISSSSVNVVPGTGTELAADCNPNDTVIKIKNGDRWIPGTFCLIAFDTDNSGAMSDLPNTNLSSINVERIEKKNGYTEVRLKGKCGKKYPAGTKVREHCSGDIYIYKAATRKTLPSEWTEFSATFSQKDCWPGTSSVRTAVLSNYNGTTDSIMLMKDVKLKEVE